MKQLIVLIGAAVALAALADDAVTAADVQTETRETPRFRGFGDYGLYSGYQLYGSLVNSEPTLQGCLEGDFDLAVGDVDLGFLGVGVWSNTDLTDKRRDSYGKAFNEWDFNAHWGRTFWFDGDKTWGLDYRTSFVWYWYPHRRHDRMRGSTATTTDWNHSFALFNPTMIVPFVDVIHEFHESDGTLLQFGLKREFTGAFGIDGLVLTPSAAFVWRNRNYGWCFPHYGLDGDGEKIGAGLATMKIMLDATYMFTDDFGVFAKIAYCSVVDADLRDAAELAHGAEYGQYKDFAWGGVGVSVRF